MNNAVVKIRVQAKTANIHYPWNTGSLQQKVGSGFIINVDGQKRILTNAHVISNNASIRVRKIGSDTEHPAAVEFISQQRDLALLKPVNPDFFNGTVALPFHDKDVAIGDTVISFGFPMGGRTITTTKGVLSRIDFNSYSFSGYDNIVYQIDAAVNPGVSGGPTLSDNQVIGVNFQGINNADNIGYIIPHSVVDDFLKDTKRSNHSAPYVHEVPFIPINYTPLQNEQLRKIIGIAPEETGILVSELSGLEEHLRIDDIILSIEGYPIGNQGNIKLFANDTISWQALISSKQIGEHVSLEIKREGQTQTIDYPLSHSYSDSYRIPSSNKNNVNYIVIGGLVIIEVNQNIYKDSQMYNLPNLTKYQRRFRKTDATTVERVLIVSNVLFHPANEFYEGLKYSVLTSINGEKLLNLEHLKTQLDKAQEDNRTIRFKGKNINSKSVFFGFTWEDLIAAREEIKSLYGVPANLY
ncbi:MAG: trypsin-like peptidase domain-containing protein [Cellvibrionales bacterium]|nr:trypsin-like peptidase domain-containing protein [Cellvibrionales bacterium]